MSGACVLDAWSFEVTVPSELVVLPDGCRDIIVRLDPHSGPTLIVSPLDAHPRWLRVAKGVAFSGLRLRPGAIVDEDALRVLWTRSPQRSAEALITQLERVVFVDPNVEEVLEALSAPAFNPAQAAKSLGVSLRALQREMKKAKLPPPQFWAQLVRARRAARGARCSRGHPARAGRHRTRFLRPIPHVARIPPLVRGDPKAFTPRSGRSVPDASRVRLRLSHDRPANLDQEPLVGVCDV